MIFYEASEYQEKVNTIYQDLYRDLLKILPMARIEHVGASSVENSVSKGDLDVFVGVEKKDFKEALEKIKTLNFYEKQGTLRTEDLCMLITEKYNYDVAVQLVTNNTEYDFFIKFRDFMRVRPDLVKKLNALKRKSEGLSPDDYRALKSQWIEKVFQKYLK